MNHTHSPGATAGSAGKGGGAATPYGLVKAYKSYVAAAADARATPSPVRGRGLLQHIRKSKENKTRAASASHGGTGGRLSVTAQHTAQEVAALEDERMQLQRQQAELEKSLAVMKEKLDVTKAQRRHYQRKSTNLANTVREQGELIGVLEMAKLDAIGSVSIDEHLSLKERARGLEEELAEAKATCRELSETAVSEVAQLTAEIASLQSTLLLKEEELCDEIAQNEDLQKRYTLAGSLGALSPQRARGTACALTQTPDDLLAETFIASHVELLVSLEASTRLHLEGAMHQALRRVLADGQEHATVLAKHTTAQQEQNKASVAGLTDCNTLLKLKIQKLERQLVGAVRIQEELNKFKTEAVREKSEKSRVVSQNALLEDRLKVTQELLDHLKKESETMKTELNKKTNLITGLETQVGELKKVSESKTKDLALIRDMKQQQLAMQEETETRFTLFFDFSEEVLAISRAERAGLMQRWEGNARDQEQTELRQLMQEQQEQLAILLNTVNTMGMNGYVGRVHHTMSNDSLERVEVLMPHPRAKGREQSVDHTTILDPGKSASAPISEEGEPQGRPHPRRGGSPPAYHGDHENGVGIRLKLTERSLAELAKVQQTPTSGPLVRRSANHIPGLRQSVPQMTRSIDTVGGLREDIVAPAALAVATAAAGVAADACVLKVAAGEGGGATPVSGARSPGPGRYDSDENLTPDDKQPLFAPLDSQGSQGMDVAEAMRRGAGDIDGDVDADGGGGVLNALGPEQLVGGEVGDIESNHDDDDLAGDAEKHIEEVDLLFSDATDEGDPEREGRTPRAAASPSSAGTPAAVHTAEDVPAAAAAADSADPVHTPNEQELLAWRQRGETGGAIAPAPEPTESPRGRLSDSGVGEGGERAADASAAPAAHDADDAATGDPSAVVSPPLTAGLVNLGSPDAPLPEDAAAMSDAGPVPNAIDQSLNVSDAVDTLDGGSTLRVGQDDSGAMPTVSPLTGGVEAKEDGDGEDELDVTRGSAHPAPPPLLQGSHTPDVAVQLASRGYTTEPVDEERIPVPAIPEHEIVDIPDAVAVAVAPDPVAGTPAATDTTTPPDTILQAPPEAGMTVAGDAQGAGDVGATLDPGAEQTEAPEAEKPVSVGSKGSACVAPVEDASGEVAAPPPADAASAPATTPVGMLRPLQEEELGSLVNLAEAQAGSPAKEKKSTKEKKRKKSSKKDKSGGKEKNKDKDKETDKDRATTTTTNDKSATADPDKTPASGCGVMDTLTSTTSGGADDVSTTPPAPAPAAAGQAGSAKGGEEAAPQPKQKLSKEERKERRRRKREAAAAAAAAGETGSKGSKESKGTLDDLSKADQRSLPAAGGDPGGDSSPTLQMTQTSSLRFETPVSTPDPLSPAAVFPGQEPEPEETSRAQDETTSSQAVFEIQDGPVTREATPAEEALDAAEEVELKLSDDVPGMAAAADAAAAPATPPGAVEEVLSLPGVTSPGDMTSDGAHFDTPASTAIQTSSSPLGPVTVAIRRSSSGKVHPLNPVLAAAAAAGSGSGSTAATTAAAPLESPTSTFVIGEEDAEDDEGGTQTYTRAVEEDAEFDIGSSDGEEAGDARPRGVAPGGYSSK